MHILLLVRLFSHLTTTNAHCECLFVLLSLQFELYIGTCLENGGVEGYSLYSEDAGAGWMVGSRVDSANWYWQSSDAHCGLVCSAFLQCVGFFRDQKTGSCHLFDYMNGKWMKNDNYRTYTRCRGAPTLPSPQRPDCWLATCCSCPTHTCPNNANSRTTGGARPCCLGPCVEGCHLW